jgi:purine-cytosine permease-like protein
MIDRFPLLHSPCSVVPTAPDDRTDTRFWNLLFLWISANFNILAFSTGSLGPAIFALGLKESLLVIFFINMLSAMLPAYLYVSYPLYAITLPEFPLIVRRSVPDLACGK